MSETICHSSDREIKEKKAGLLLPTIIGIIVWVGIAVSFNKYYFAGSGFWDPMPLTHLTAGIVLGVFSGLLGGFIIRRK